MEKSESSRREFLLYWIGLLVVAISFVGILLTISGLIVNVLTTQCYIPYISPMLGVTTSSPQPMPIEPNATTTNQSSGGPYVNTMYPNPYPYYCGGNLAAYTISFIFNLLSAFIFIAVGCYMMLNGKKL